MTRRQLLLSAGALVGFGGAARAAAPVPGSLEWLTSAMEGPLPPATKAGAWIWCGRPVIGWEIVVEREGKIVAHTTGVDREDHDFVLSSIGTAFPLSEGYKHNQRWQLAFS